MTRARYMVEFDRGADPAGYTIVRDIIAKAQVSASAIVRI